MEKRSTGVEAHEGHEERDVSPRPIALVGLGVLLVTLLVLVLIWRLVGALAAREANQSPPASPLKGAFRREPPNPRLQTHPIDDLRELRNAEEAALGHYGWVERGTGVTRIPIERAIELLAERGLPAAGGAPRKDGSPDAGSPSAGQRPPDAGSPSAGQRPPGANPSGEDGE